MLGVKFSGRFRNSGHELKKSTFDSMIVDQPITVVHVLLFPSMVSDVE